MEGINNLVKVLEKHRDQHLEHARKLNESIQGLQSLCQHDKTVWIGNDHNHDYYRCQNCRLILKS